MGEDRQGGSVKEGRRGLIKHVANAITASRLLLIPVFLGCLAYPGEQAFWAAALLFGVAAMTDLADGYVARRYSGVSDFGKALDPVADRALIAAAVIGLFLRGGLPAWAFGLLLSRDAILAAGYIAVKVLKKPLVKISQFGRTVNFYLMLTIFLLFLNLAADVPAFFIWLFYLGVVLYMATGLVYIIQEIDLLKRVREGE